MSSLVPVSPEEDTDAQDKIWNDKRLGAKELHRRWNVRLFLGLDEESDLLSSERTPFFGGGKLVELLSVVSFLRTADFIPPQKVLNCAALPSRSLLRRICRTVFFGPSLRD